MITFYPVKFAPIPMERIWGGHQLKKWFMEERPESIGEYWVLSGHPNGTSVVMNGHLAGESLVDLCSLYPEAYLGRSSQNRFPLLVKFLEAHSDLSVQIHPNDEYATKYEGDFGKTEAWYVLDCPPDGKVNYGHSFSSKQEYLRAVSDGRVKDYLRYQTIQPGQLVFVPAQTLHALLAGTKVIEVQQTSDITYRVYDWDRVDVNGNPRALHVEKAAEVIPFNGATNFSAIPIPTVIQEKRGVQHKRLASCQYFTIESLIIDAETHQLCMGNEGNPDVLIVADGSGQLRWKEGDITLQRGDTLLVPATLRDYAIETEGAITILRTYY